MKHTPVDRELFNADMGALLWVLSLQYYIVQVLVAAAWLSIQRYSWIDNTISDLGNTACDVYGIRYVCSPWHVAMNASFVLLGLTMAGGSYFLHKTLVGNRLVSLGLGCMAAAGVGTLFVGLFPENTIAGFHIVGAALPFVLGNVGMLLLGIYLRSLSYWLRWLTILFGLMGLIALALFMTHTYLGLGIGGMERLVAYPQTIWMIIAGGWLLMQRQKSV